MFECVCIMVVAGITLIVLGIRLAKPAWPETENLIFWMGLAAGFVLLMVLSWMVGARYVDTQTLFYMCLVCGGVYAICSAGTHATGFVEDLCLAASSLVLCLGGGWALTILVRIAREAAA